jgi:hypothetical protein
VQEQVIHSRSGRIIAAAGFIFATLGIVALAIESIDLLITSSWAFIWIGFLSWLLFWNPSIRITEDGVHVENVFTNVFLSWSSIVRIDTKYSLTLETKEKTFQAWAAPAPSRYSAFMANKTEAQHLPESSFVGKGMIRPGDLTSSDSGVAAFLVRSHWEKLRDRGELSKEPVIRRSVGTLRVVSFFVLTAVALVSLIF